MERCTTAALLHERRDRPEDQETYYENARPPLLPTTKAASSDATRRFHIVSQAT